MECYVFWLATLLVISVVVAFYIRRKWKEAEESYNEIKRLNQELEHLNQELEHFQGYKKEAIKLRNNIKNNLPEGMNQISSLMADMDKYLAVLEEDYRYHGRDRMRARVWQSPEVKRLRNLLKENKELQYKNELLTRKCNTLFEEKIEEITDDSIRTELIEYKRKAQERGQIVAEITNKQKKLWDLESDIKDAEVRLQRLRELCENKSKELSNISADYWKRREEEIRKVQEKINLRIQEAKERLEDETDTPRVLKLIAKAWVDYKVLWYEKAIAHLLTKEHPISINRAKDFERSLRLFKDEILIEYKETQYKYAYLLSLFPDLEEYIDGDAVRENKEDVKEEYEDRRIAYLSREEWESLSDREKSQRALDNYNEARRRTKSQVGRDYEEYIAYLFRQELKGCDITMFGEQKGLADLGRDLIVKHKNKVYVVQCKRWSEGKTIHEKHIMQLFGTTIEYCWDIKSRGVSPLEIVGKSVIPVFVTTTELSATAIKFAERLGVVICKQAIGEYPQIKCNIGKDGNMIYHLPFDQQYNNTIIEHNKGEFYAWSVEQAENAGYRRAMKYYYN